MSNLLKEISPILNVQKNVPEQRSLTQYDDLIMTIILTAICAFLVCCPSCLVFQLSFMLHWFIIMKAEGTITSTQPHHLGSYIQMLSTQLVFH